MKLDETNTFWTDILFRFREIIAGERGPSLSTSRPSPKVGRPRIYDWAAAAGAAARFELDNDTKSSGEIVKFLQTWFDKSGRAPDVSELKRFAKAMMEG